MEEKHIYSSSPWKKLQDKLVLFKQELQKTVEELKSKPSKQKPPVINTEAELPKKIQLSTPEIISYAKPYTEKSYPKKSKSKISKVNSRELDQKIFVVILSTTIIFVIGLGIFLSFKSYLPSQKVSDKSPQTQNIPSPTERANARVVWKTYIQHDNSFSISYPPDWELTQNPQNDPLASIGSIRIKGSEGDIYITSNVEAGGACPEGYQEILIGNEKEKTCNYTNESGVEGWEQIYIEFPDSTLEIRAYTNKPSVKSEELIKEILSTFKFTDSENYEGKFCGGFAGITCPEGYFCRLDGNYPDAGGTCVKK